MDGEQVVSLEFRPLSTPPLHVLYGTSPEFVYTAAVVPNGVNSCVAMVPSVYIYVNGV